jgi:hypothetical protein
VTRGVNDPEELATLVRYAVNVEDKEEFLAFSPPSISYLNHMISRPQTTTPILTWGREIVVRTMRELVSAPLAFNFPPLENIPTLIMEKLIRLCCEQKLIPWLQVKREDLKIFEIIGKGAYGKVRKAHFIRTPNPKEPEEVAMKEFNVEDCLFDESLKNEILRETAIMW